MTTIRRAIGEFQLANPIYTGAQVSFYSVDDEGVRTATLATLYIAPTGATTAANPQTLDSEGKFSAPVYTALPVIAEVVGPNVETHSTGVIQIRGTWRGDWATDSVYYASDLIQDSDDADIYVAVDDHTSGASVAADVTAGHLEKIVDQLTLTAIPLASGLWGPFTNVASAATANIGTANSIFINITGAVGISSLGSSPNRFRVIKTASAVVFTQSASLLIPNGEYTSVAGEPFIAVSDASGIWTLLIDNTVLQTGTGALVHTVQERATYRLNVLDFIPKSEWAAIRAYTSTTDLATYINAAITRINVVKGQLDFPSGLYPVASAVGVSGLNGISLQGEGGRDLAYGTGTLVGTIIKFTGTGTGDILNLQNHRAIAVRDMQVVYSSNSFTGTMINLNVTVPSAQFPVSATGCGSIFERVQCYQITNNLHTAGRCFYLKNNVDVTFNNCYVSHADYGWIGLFNADSGETNMITLIGCTSTALNLAAIHNPVTGWTLVAHNFEPSDDVPPKPIGITTGGSHDIQGLGLYGCVAADAQASGTWFDLINDTYNFTMIGGEILALAGTVNGIRLGSAFNGTPVINGVKFDGMSGVAISYLATTTGAVVIGCEFFNVGSVYSGQASCDAGSLFMANNPGSANRAIDPIYGGTGLTSGTSGGIPYFSSTTTIASSALLATNAIVRGGGAGSAPNTAGPLIDGSNNLTPATDGASSLGTATVAWANVFIDNGGAVNFDNSDVRILHSGANTLQFTGATSGYIFSAVIAPTANDGAPIGASGVAWSDLFLASGAVIDFAAGDVTITHSANLLAHAGATSGYSFDAKVFPASDDGAALGDTTHNFSDLFLALGAVINFNNGDVTVTHSANLLAFAGASSGYTVDAVLKPSANDGAALGASGTAWSDLHLASGAVINFVGGDVNITHSTNALTFTGATSGYVFDSPVGPTTNDGASLGVATIAWADLFLASGGVIDFNNGDVTITHSANLLAHAGATSGYSFDAKVFPASDDGAALGDTTHNFSDLFLATGAVVNFANGDITITHSANLLAFAGATSGYSFDTLIKPSANDGAALGVSGTAWADLFLASGGVIDFAAGDVTITHSANLLAFAGASSGYTFDAAPKPSANDAAALGVSGTAWSDLFLASGAVINFLAGDVTITHSADLLAFGGAASGYTFDAVVKPSANDGAALGASGTAWSDLFLASGGVINFAAGDVTITHVASDILRFQGAAVGYTFSHAVFPESDDGAPLGGTALKWSDLFLASGAVINFNSGDVTITHSTNLLALAGASSGYSVDAKFFPTTDDGAALGDTTHNFSDLFLASGAVINFNNSDVTLTHSADTLTMAGGSLVLGTPLNYPSGGTGVAFPAMILGGYALNVNANSANTDTAITISLPSGVTKYRVQTLLVSNIGTTASLTTATAGLFVSAAGAGLALAADQALSNVTSNADDADASIISMTITIGARTRLADTTLFFRIGTAQGAAATVNVYVFIYPLPTT